GAVSDDVIFVGGSSTGTGTSCSHLSAKSTNGGATFTDSATGLHASSHVIAVHPANDNIIYHANDGGIWKSTDGGATWVSLNPGGLSITDFVSVATHSTDTNFLLAGANANGTLLRDPNGVW